MYDLQLKIIFLMDNKTTELGILISNGIDNRSSHKSIDSNLRENTNVHISSTCPNTVRDLRLRGTVVMPTKDVYSSVHMKPFQNAKMIIMSSFLKELKAVASDQKARRIFLLGILNIVCSSVLLAFCHSTNSMALTAYTYLTFFDLLVLLSCFLSLWVEQQKPTSLFSFGYERFEVIAVFASTILAQLGSLFVIKESIERVLLLPEINTRHFLMAAAIAFCCHIIITYGINNKSWKHVTSAASSSWLQEHVADMSQSICHVIPGLSTLLLPRINPMMLIAFAGGLALFITQLLVEMNNYQMADPLAAIGIAMMTCGTMFPMSVYSGKILLQTAPSHIIGQLDKCLREASTLDGVLEFRNEHFWTLSFGILVGSLHVRIRRDANEQLVLAHLMDRLSNLVSILTVQVCKDDWTRGTTFQLLNDMALLTPTKSISSSMHYPSESTFTNKMSVPSAPNDAMPRATSHNYLQHPASNHHQTGNAVNLNSLVLQIDGHHSSVVAKSPIHVPISELECR